MLRGLSEDPVWVACAPFTAGLCLENPRDGGAWWAAVYGVTQSLTRLKRLSSMRGLVGCRLWGRTESDTTEAT